MNSIRKLIEKGSFDEAYRILNKDNKICLEWICRELKGVDSKSVVLFLIYLIAVEETENDVILLCEYLLYMDPPFGDIHPVIKLFLKMQIEDNSSSKILKWVIDTYESHPDSPFSQGEINAFKNRYI